jgi:hypothetical protein
VSNVSYEKVADILESVATYVDGIEHTKSAAEKSARDTRITTFASRYETSTGESLPSSLRDKLANLDQESLDQLLKVANNTGDSPESLGGPAETSDNPPPRTVKEAAAQADNKFLDWIINE